MRTEYSNRIIHFAASAMLLAAVLVPLEAAAQDRFWAVDEDGYFGDQNNWDPAEIPGAGAWAIFSRMQYSAYTVTMLIERTIGSFQVRNDRVVLDLDGNDFNLTQAYTWTDSSPGDGGMTALAVAAEADSVGTLTLVNSGSEQRTVSAASLVLGGAAGSHGHLVLDGLVRLDLPSGVSARVGHYGDASLTLRNGAVMTMEQLVLSRSGLVHASILLEGAGTELKVEAEDWSDLGLSGGLRGSADILVRDGAHLDMNKGVLLIAERNEPCTITIQNATASLHHMSLGYHTAGSEGTLRVIDGSTVNTRAMSLGAPGGAGDERAVGIVEISGGATIVQATDREVSIGGHAATDHNTRGTFTVDTGGAKTGGRDLYVHSRGTLALNDGTFSMTRDMFVADGEEAEPAYNLTLHAGTTAAPLSIGGDVTLGKLAFTLDLAPGFDADVDEVFEILGYGGTLDGTFLGRDDQSTVTHGSGYEFLLDYGTRTDDVVTLQVTMIPEPGTLVLLLAGAGLLAARRRRV